MITVAAILAEFGAYYQNRGQSLANLLSRAMREFQTQQVFRTVSTDSQIWQMAEVAVTELLQPFQKFWTPKGTVTFTPSEIRTWKMKVDYECYPDDVDGTWAGFLIDNDLNRINWPIVRYIVEQKLLPKIQEDLELLAIYNGERVEPAQGVPGAGSEAMDGIKKVINDHDDNGRVTKIILGAPPSDPVQYVEYVEDFVSQWPEEYRNRRIPVVMSEDLSSLYQQGFDLKYNVNYAQVTNQNTVRYRRAEIVGLPSHKNSTKIWASPYDNNIRLVRRGQNVNRMAMEQEDRKVKMWTDFEMGVGFAIPELVFTNDQDLSV